MLRALCCLLFFPTMFYAQENKPVPDSASRMATVDVTVTDNKGKPRKGEVVIFRGETSGKLYSGTSGPAGKFKQVLPPGDRYHVSVKSISDTTKYTILVIPSLA